MVSEKITTALSHPLVLFDGFCNLCNASVQTIIKNDPDGYFHFAALQSETGQYVLENNSMDKKDLKTFILLENGKVYTRSSAALKVASRMKFPYKLLTVFLIVPPFIRNAVYNIIASNRYKWFGKRDSCMMPTPELKARFHD